MFFPPGQNTSWFPKVSEIHLSIFSIVHSFLEPLVIHWVIPCLRILNSDDQG
jgi:hypothetical protein